MNAFYHAKGKCKQMHMDIWRKIPKNQRRIFLYSFKFLQHYFVDGDTTSSLSNCSTTLWTATQLVPCPIAALFCGRQ